MVILTRLLYCFDEVKINLLLSILKKEDFKEVVFWAIELYESKYEEELINLIWKIYYDFFGLKTSFSLLKYKNDIRNYNKTKKFVFICSFLNKLFQSKYTFDIFILRHFFKNRQINDLKPENYEKIVKVVFSKNRPELVNKFLKLGLNFKKEKELIKMVEKIKGKIKFKCNEYYSDLYHKLIVYLYSENLKIKTSLKSIKKPIIKFIENIQNIDLTTPERVLQTYRIYEISPLTSCFNLQRELLNKEITECFWYNWEYYAYNCKWWKEKMQKFKHIKDDKKKEIIFTNEDEMEDFYKTYSYELDELNYETRNKSTKTLKYNIGLNDLLLELDEKLKLILNISNKLELFKNKY